MSIMTRYEQQLNRCLVFVETHGSLSDKLAAAEVRKASRAQGGEAVAMARKWLAMSATEGGHINYSDVTTMAEALTTHPRASVPDEWREVLEGCVSCFNCPEWSDKCEQIEQQAKRLLATTPQPEDTTCKWTEDEGMWNSECGYGLWYEDGTPSECGQKYCPKCGKPCVEVPNPPSEGEE